MEYKSVKETAKKWDISMRRVQTLCSQNRIQGAQKIGNSYIIPEDAQKPIDKRYKYKEGK